MGIVGWEDIGKDRPEQQGKSDGSSDRSLYLNLPEGEHRLRLAGKAFALKVAYIKNPETSKNEKFVVPDRPGDTYIQRLRALKQNVGDYWAINCFYRGDTEKGITRLRILEKGISIFQVFRNYYKNYEDDNGNPIDPGGKDGPDWKIVTVPKPGPDGVRHLRNVEYQVMPLKQVPFSKEELEILARTKNPEKWEKEPLSRRGLIDFNKLYDMDKAAEKLDKRLAQFAGIEIDKTESSEKNEQDEGQSIEDVLSNSNDDKNDSKKKEEDVSSQDIDKILDEVF